MILPDVVIQFHHLETSFPIDMTENSVPCTYSVNEYTVGGETYQMIEYSFIYEDNPAIGCGWQFCPKCECLGYHLGDRERLIFLMQNDVIKAVCFKAHGHGQEMWKRWEDCAKTNEGILIAYVARGSHAFYPRPTRYWRVFGFANDLNDNGGPRRSIVRTGIHNDNYVPKNHSITPFLRFILPLSLPIVQNWS